MSGPRSRIPLGVNVSADPLFLARVRSLVDRHADFLELSPETWWVAGPVGSGLLASGAARPVLEGFVRACGKPVVGHGLCYSAGTVGDEERQARWRARIVEDREVFEYGWYSEHLGFATAGGLTPTLPLPLPATQAAVEAAAKNLRALHAAAGAPVAVENWASSFALGDPRDDGCFFAALCEHTPCGLLLDLHNVYVTAVNTGVDPDAVLESFPLERVLAIHVAGGRLSEADWLASRRTFWLDSHDASPPDWVWSALERVLPRCTALRGVIVERLDRALDATGLAEWERDLEHARGLLDRAASRPIEPVPPAASAFESLPEGEGPAELAELEIQLAKLLAAEDPERALLALRTDDPPSFARLRSLDPDGLLVASLLVQKIRFSRLCTADPKLASAFERDPRSVGGELRRYLTEVPPMAWFPSEELELFSRWRADPACGRGD